MNENRHRTLSLMNDIHPEYVVNVAFGGAKDGIDGKIGRDGEPGKDGAPGEDGFSPIVEAYRNPDDTGIIVRVTDKDGTRETYVQDGASSSGDIEPVLYIKDEYQYTDGYSILKYDAYNIPDGYDHHYLDSTFIMQIVAIGHGEFSSGKRYSAYFAISFAGYSHFAGEGVLPTGITSTFLCGDFKPMFEIRHIGEKYHTILSLELFNVGKSVEDAGFEDFDRASDVAIYIHNYSGSIPYDEFSGFFKRTDRINPLEPINPNYDEIVDRSKLFNQRLDDVLRFRNVVSGDPGHTTDTSIRATDIEMSTDGDRPGKISLESAETSNGQTRIQSGKIWLGDYNSSGDYEKLITLDAINNSWRSYQTVIQNGELSLRDLDSNYRTVVISGTSNKPYIDMRSDSNSSTHSIKLQVNGDKGSTNIINGQIVLKDGNGNKQIDISSRTNGKGIIKMSDVKVAQSELKDGMRLVRLYNTNGDGLFTIGQDGIQYASLDGPSGVTFFDTPQIDKTIPTLPENPNIQVNDGAFTPTWQLDGRTPSCNDFWYAGLSRGIISKDGYKYLHSDIHTNIMNNGNDIIYSYRRTVAGELNGSYRSNEIEHYTGYYNDGYNDVLTARLYREYPGEPYHERGGISLCDAVGSSTLIITTDYDDNDEQYDEIKLAIRSGSTVAVVGGKSLTVDDRLYLNEHKLSDIVTYNQVFMNGGNLVLRNNTIFTADAKISSKSFSYTGGDCIIEFTTSASGSITISFPVTITFDELPTFGNDEHWIIGIRDGWAVWTMYDLSQ